MNLLGLTSIYITFCKGHSPDILHGSVVEFRDNDLVVFLERKGIVEELRVEIHANHHSMEVFLVFKILR